MIKTWMFSLALLATLGAVPAIAAPPATTETRQATVRARVTSQDDGTVLVQMILTAQEREQADRMPQVTEGLPKDPSRMGRYKGELFGRYRVAPDAALEKELERLMGQEAILTFNGKQQVVKVERAIAKR